jgi:hypothetical protein
MSHAGIRRTFKTSLRPGRPKLELILPSLPVRSLTNGLTGGANVGAGTVSIMATEACRVRLIRLVGTDNPLWPGLRDAGPRSTGSASVVADRVLPMEGERLCDNPGPVGCLGRPDVSNEYVDWCELEEILNVGDAAAPTGDVRLCGGNGEEVGDGEGRGNLKAGNLRLRSRIVRSP